jgi:hypothetical protein
MSRFRRENVRSCARNRGAEPLCMNATVARTFRLTAIMALSGACAFLSPVGHALSPKAFAQTVPAPVVRPQPPQPTALPLKQAKTKLVEFEMSPFPYEGINPATGRPFINTDESGRRGRTTGSGRVYWEDETYSDQRVLLHIPEGFDIRKPAIIIVFFHGHGAAIDRDVRDRQRVAEQISKSGSNAVLVAPQMAVKAADSSAGIFWEQGMFAQFLNEAAEQLAILHGGFGVTRTFAGSPRKPSNRGRPSLSTSMST